MKYSTGKSNGAMSAQAIWEAALGALQVQVNKANYRTWLSKTVGLSYQDNQFVIGVPNTFVAEYLEQNQRSLIEKSLIGLTNDNIKVSFYVNGNRQKSPEEALPTPTTSYSRLNPHYTFDSFIVSSCNCLAHAAALKVAENPGQSYNPLFIYGGVGLGKTHLLHAIGHAARAREIRVLSASAERFTNEFINAIRARSTLEFHDKYRGFDILLLDDIHFISGKEQTEECFVHTFNELHNANRQIVLTSDRLPKSMPLLNSRLRSRFEWGLIADMQPPDFDTRLAILRAKSEHQGVSIPSEVLGFIAHRAQQNIRELEGCLNRVTAYAKLTRAAFTPELAARALKDIASKAPPSATTTPSLVIEAVANSFQLTPTALKSRQRDRAIALAQKLAIYLMRQEINCSLAQIGQELGGRGPSTIIQAYKTITSDIDANPNLRDKIAEIQHRLYHNAKSGKNS